MNTLGQYQGRRAHPVVISYLLLSTALQLLVQSCDLLNHFLPFPILDKGLPIWHF